MSQLLSGKHKGRFAAPPPEGKKRSPWAYIPIYVLLPLTIVFVAFSAVPAVTYYVCSDRDSEICLSTNMPDVRNGTFEGIATFTGAMLLLAFVLVIVAAVRLKKGPVWLCWAMAAAGLVLAIFAFLMLNGSLPTPVGEIIPLEI